MTPEIVLSSPHRGNTSPEMLLLAARSYVEAGLSVIPIGKEKRPFFNALPKEWDKDEQKHKPTWAPFQHRLPTFEELEEWFITKKAPGLAVLGGRISHNLEVLDVDAPSLWALICEELDQHLPGSVEKLFVIQSPRGGFQIPFRCDEIAGSEKLALKPVPVAEDTKGARQIPNRDGWFQIQTLIETKGEGGYVVTYPSSPSCHPLTKKYEPLAGDWLEIPVITPTERDLLLTIARSFNEYEEEESQPYAPQDVLRRDGLRPGDDFNLRASWDQVLSPHGFSYRGRSRGVERWRRPGDTKWKSHAAVLNNEKGGYFVSFSSSIPGFDEKKAYSKFAVYTQLNYGSLTKETFKLATKDLAAQGYGDSFESERIEIENRNEIHPKDIFNQVVAKLFSFWNISDKSFRAFITFDALMDGCKSKRLTGNVIAQHIRTLFCEGSEDNDCDFGNRRMNELISELGERVTDKIITRKEKGGKPLKWDHHGTVIARSASRYEYDRSILDVAVALAHCYEEEDVKSERPDPVAAREKAAIEVAKEYAKTEPASKKKKTKDKDAYAKEVTAEIAFKKQLEKLVESWIEQELDPITMRSRWGRLVKIGDEIYQKRTSAEARNRKRKGKKLKTDIFDEISPQKTAPNLSSERDKPLDRPSILTPSSIKINYRTSNQAETEVL